MTKDPKTLVLRDELKIVRTHRRAVERDLTAAAKCFRKAKAEFTTAKRNCAGALRRLDRRAAILNGRLAA
jgi:hypothetical protein